VLAAVVAQAAPLLACGVILVGLRARPRMAAGLAIASLVAATLATGLLVARVALARCASPGRACRPTRNRLALRTESVGRRCARL